MEVTGLVVAASETLRFELENGILFRIQNASMDTTFHLLCTGDFLHLWRKVKVCECYKFSNLSLSAIQLVSGSRTIVFKAASDSLYYEIKDTDVKHFVVPDSIKEKLFFPRNRLVFSNHPSSRIISYQGFVTKVESQLLKVYELDNKIKLYCTFNAYHSPLTLLREGQEVFVSNSHFFKDQESKKLLVCCGLSSVRLIKAKEKDLVTMECTSVGCSLFHHHLSVNDLPWLETFVSCLNLKLQPYFVQSCPFQLESQIIEEVMQAFILLTTKSSTRLSLGEEFFSYPHECSAFSEDILPVRCKIPLIVEILDSACSEVWMENSKSWKFKCIPNKTNNVLVGLLFYSKDGWFIKDRSATVPFVLTSACDECNFESNVLCQDQDPAFCRLVVVQNFETVFEKIKKGDAYHSCCYFRTGCCCLFQLKDYFIDKNGLYEPNFSQNSKIIQNVLDKLGNMCLEKGRVEKTPFPTDFNITDNYICQSILVLCKIWTGINKTLTSHQVLALVLADEKSCQSFVDSSKCLFEDSCDLYDANDSDISELMEEMNSLSLNEDILVRLHFESARDGATLLPGHKYEVFDPSFSSYRQFSVFDDRNYNKPQLVKIKPRVKIFHSKACSGSPLDYNSGFLCDIEEIISRKSRIILSSGLC